MGEGTGHSERTEYNISKAELLISFYLKALHRQRLMSYKRLLEIG